VSPCETHHGSLLPSAGACMTDCLHKQNSSWQIRDCHSDQLHG
jgi:hypothetical protein